MATQHGLELTWTEATQGTTFNVFRGTTAGGEDYNNPIATALTTESFLDTTGVAGTTYFYTVEAVLNGVASAPSNEGSGVFPTVPASPVLSVTAQ